MVTSQAMPPYQDSITIRHCRHPEDFKQCVELQTAVWHFDAVDVVGSHILVVAHEIGGQVLGAYDGDRMVGFALALPATRHGKVHLHSHMAAVAPEYQDRGIGRMLKLAQRDDALARGIDLIEWTFDPLQPRNANFGIARLGAIARRYIPDCYGSSTSPLHANLPTDRLVAEWHLNSERVRARAAGQYDQATKDLPMVSVPREIAELRRKDPALARDIQARMRHEFMAMFGRGYAVTGFSTTETDGNYLLEKL